MNSRELIRVTVVFAVLAVAGIGLAVGSLAATDPDVQRVLIPIGSAMFGAALAFFLIQIFKLDRRTQE